MDVTSTDFTWSATPEGFFLAALTLLGAVILGWLLGHRWRDPSDPPV